MSSNRLAYAWIACFAVLFNLLAMPMSASAAKAPADQLLWGAFCSTGGTKLVAISLGALDDSQQSDEHPAMQHCWCCSGNPSPLALPGHMPRLFLPSPALAAVPVVQPPSQPGPRQLWPSLNPRASPSV